MFGYASNETDVLMPAPITYAHRLMAPPGPPAQARRAAVAAPRRQEPGDYPLRRRQAGGDRRGRGLDPACAEHLARRPARGGDRGDHPSGDPAEWLHAGTRFHVNPTGQFIIGGPLGDCGLTGARSSSTATAAWRATAARVLGKDPAKVRPFGRLRRPVTWPRTWLQRASPTAARSRSPTRSAWRSDLDLGEHLWHRQALGRGITT